MTSNSIPTGASARRAAPRAGAFLLALALVSTSVVLTPETARAAHAPNIPIGSLTDFSVLAATMITDTGGTSHFSDGAGVSPGVTITGIDQSDLDSGGIHINDAVAQQARSDLLAAYAAAAGASATTIAAELGGTTLLEGVYRPGEAALGLTTSVTLDGGGDKNAVFIIQTAGAFDAAAAASVVLVNGAQECNVFWQVQGAVTIGAGANFRGIILAEGAVTVGALAQFHGRAFTRSGAMTLSANQFIEPTCVGVTVTPTSGLVTSEAGGTASFTVVLKSQPTGEVTVARSSSDLTEGTVAAADLTFTTANWNTPQTVTVTGVDDSTVDGPIGYTILLAPAAGGDYAGVNPTDVAVTNTDNDVLGVTVTLTAVPLVTTESGGTATFTVVLDTQPTGDVTIGKSSSDVTEGTVAAADLTFTSVNWNTPQTVTVTGVDDSTVDGPIGYTIPLAPATGGGYTGVDPGDVAVTNTDNDVNGVTVTPGTLPLLTTEAGGTATFTVVLDTQPTADVTIARSSNDTTEGTVPTSDLTFTTANWNVAQTVTVTGVDDSLADGDVAYSVILAPAIGGGYTGVDPTDVAVTNNDNDAIGVTVMPTSGLVTTEGGGTASFTVMLDTQPTADVTIGKSSSDLTEGTVVVTDLTFTTANWNTPQTVFVTGVDDSIDDGNVAYTLILAPAVGGDYTGVNPADVAVSNSDNDTAGVTVTPTTVPLVTTEAGGTASFTVVLDTQPTADVTIARSSSDTTEGTVVTTDLTFTAANWNTAQTVTITGADDSIDDGDLAYTVLLATAVGGGYAGIDPVDIAVTNTDNDTAGVAVTPTSALVTTEAGGTATFTVVLDTQPTADVTIGRSSNDLTEGTVVTTDLTFTAANWNTAQTVTVTGADDFIDDGDLAYTVLLATAVGGGYAGVDPADVGVTNTDNDVLGVTVTPTSGLVTTEAGGTATFTVVLDTQPSADVTIGRSSNDLTEGTVVTTDLTFTTANWNTAQTVTVTGANDSLVDGSIGYTVLLALAVGGGYAGIDPADVAVTNTDNDAAPAATVEPLSRSGLVDTSFACPGSIATSGFADVGPFDAPTVQAIDCISHYGISNGTSDVAFSPGDPVARWQMALFLIRQAEVHGVDLPVPVDQGFTDVVAYDRETRDAISQLSQLRITKGTGPDTFAPGDPVSRWEMALFLVRFLAVIGVPVPHGVSSTAFTDMGSFEVETNAAVDQLVRQGVAAGTSATTFDPTDDVLRWQMALFLTRVLAVDGVFPS